MCMCARRRDDDCKTRFLSRIYYTYYTQRTHTNTACVRVYYCGGVWVDLWRLQQQSAAAVTTTTPAWNVFFYPIYRCTHYLFILLYGTRHKKRVSRSFITFTRFRCTRTIDNQIRYNRYVTDQIDMGNTDFLWVNVYLKILTVYNLKNLYLCIFL